MALTRPTVLTRDRQATGLQPRVSKPPTSARPSYEEWINDRLRPIIDELFAGRTKSEQITMSDHQLEIFAGDHGSVKINTNNGNIGTVLRRLYSATHSVQIRPRGRRKPWQKLLSSIRGLHDEEMRFPRVITIRPIRPRTT